MNNPVFFGVWLPGAGWLRVKGSVYADERQEVAAEIAARLGNGARAYHVDGSITELESAMLDAERRTWRYKLWHIWSNLNNYNRK